MTPEQRAAAERLVEGGEPSNRLMPDELQAWADDAAHLLRELLAAEPVQEPVAYIDQRQLAAGYVTLLCITRPEYRSYADVAEGIHYTPVYLHPPQQPMHCPKDGGECGAGGYCRPEPVQRRPLSDEQINRLDTEAIHGGPDSQYAFRFARAVEKAHSITGEQE